MADPRRRASPQGCPATHVHRTPHPEPAELAGDVVEFAALEQPAVDSVAGCSADAG